MLTIILMYITNNNQICYKSYLSLIWHPLSSVLCYKYMQENQTKESNKK